MYIRIHTGKELLESSPLKTMQRSDLNADQYEGLMQGIFGILADKGPAQTTMDLVAHKLGMSKRTLYEIFESKDDMLKCVLEYLQQRNCQEIEEIIRRSDNVMEAMANILVYHQQMMNKICVDFFIDMDKRYRHLRGDYETNARKWNDHLNQAIILGIKQGVFREDTNYEIFVPLMRVQMESLKRMEEFFPKGITLLQAYNAICVSMLRSIATEKGMQILEKLYPKFQNNKETIKKQR